MCDAPSEATTQRQANDRSAPSREFENRLAGNLAPKCLHRPDNLVQTFHGLLQSSSGDPDCFKHHLHTYSLRCHKKVPRLYATYVPACITVDFVTQLPSASK